MVAIKAITNWTSIGQLNIGGAVGPSYIPITYHHNPQASKANPMADLI
jgi:hypothetical protein